MTTATITGQRWDIAYRPAPQPEPTPAEPIALDSLRVTVKTRDVWQGNMTDNVTSNWVTDGYYLLAVNALPAKRVEQFRAKSRLRYASDDAVERVITNALKLDQVSARILPLAFPIQVERHAPWYATYLQGENGQIVTVNAHRLALITRSLKWNYNTYTRITVSGAGDPVLFWCGPDVIGALMPMFADTRTGPHATNVARALT